MGARLVIVGDFNTEYLPTLTEDPWQHLADDVEGLHLSSLTTSKAVTCPTLGRRPPVPPESFPRSKKIKGLGVQEGNGMRE